MSKEILLPKKVKSEMLKTFGVNKSDLYRALTFKNESDRSRMLQAAAKERGGLIYMGPVPAEFVPKCDTEFDHGKGVIIQSFGERARITISKTRATVEVEGCDPITIDNVTTGNWRQLLYGVQQIVNSLT